MQFNKQLNPSKDTPVSWGTSAARVQACVHCFIHCVILKRHSLGFVHELSEIVDKETHKLCLYSVAASFEVRGLRRPRSPTCLVYREFHVYVSISSFLTLGEMKRHSYFFKICF